MTRRSEIGVDVTGRDELSPIFKQLESGIIRFVGAVSSALTAIAVIGFPVKAAAEFQKSLIEVKKTTDFSVESMKALKEGVQALSKETDVSAVELARIASLGGKMGLGREGPEALLAFTEELSRAVTALDVNADLAAEAMGKLINIFDLPIAKFRNAIATINQLANTSTASGEEIMDIMRRIGNIGGSVTFEQSAALAALAIDLGTTAETAGTSISKIFARMKADASSFSSFMSMSMQEWISLVDTDGVAALQAFLTQLNKLPSEIAAASKVQLTGGGRIFELVTKLQNQMRLGDSSRMAFLLKEANQEWLVGTSAIREQKNVLTGFLAQWDIFINKMNVGLVAGGDKALGALARGISALGETISGDDFIKGFESFVERVVTIFTTVGEVIGSITSALGATQVDWSVIFDIAGLVTLSALLKSLPMLMNLAAMAAKSMLGISSAAAAAGAATAGAAGGAAAATASTAAHNSLAAAMKNYAASVVATTRVEAIRQGLAARTTTLTAELSAAQSRAAAMAIRQTTTVNTIEAQLAAARLNRAQAMMAGNVAQIASTNALIATLTKQQAYVQSGYAAALAKERLAVAAIRAQMVADAERAQARIDRAMAGSGMGGSAFLAQLAAMRAAAVTTFTVIGNAILHPVKSLLLLRQAAAASIGMIVPLGVRLGLLANTAIIAAGAITVLARAMGLLTRAGAMLMAVVSKLFMVLILLSLGKMVAEWLGVWEPISKFLDKVIDSVNKMFGMKIPKFSDKADAEARSAALQKEIAERDRLYASAEAFARRFGSIESRPDIDPIVFQKSIAQMEKAMERYNEVLKGDITAKAGGEFTPSQVFIEGANSIVLMTRKLEALAAKMRDIQRNTEKNSLNLGYDPTEILALEAVQGRSVEQERQLNDLYAKRDKFVAKALELRQQEVETTRAMTAVEEGRAKVIATVLSSLEGTAELEWFSGMLLSLKQADEMVKQVTASKEKLESEINNKVQQGTPIDQNTVDLRADLATAETEAKARLANIQQEFRNTQTTIALAGGATKEFTETLTDMDVGTLVAVITEATGKAGASISQMTEGLGTLGKDGKTQAEMAGQMMLAMQLGEQYRRLGESARDGAAIAQNAVTQAVSQANRDIESLFRTFQDVDANLRAASQKANENDISKEDKSALDDKLLKLDIEKKKKLEIAKLEYDTHKINYEELLKRENAIEREFAAKRTGLEDEAKARSAVRGKDTAVMNFAADKKEAEALIETLNKVSEIMGSDLISASDKDKQLIIQREAAASLEAVLGRMKNTMVDLSKTDPIGNKLVVTAKDIDPMKRAIEEVQKGASQAKLASTRLVAEQMGSLAASYDEIARAADNYANSAASYLSNLVGDVHRTKEQIAAALAAMWSDPRIKAAQDEFTRSSNDATTFSGSRMTGKEFEAQMKTYQQVVADLYPEGIPVGITINKNSETELQEAMSKFSAVLKVPLNFDLEQAKLTGKPPEVGVDGKFDETQLQSGLKDVKGLSVDIQGNIVTSGNTSGRGPKPINNRDGGHIRGPGTGRSDSILSWLSNGEYVMDAKTVRTFGSGFFQLLQSLAKRGVDLKAIMPTFADGGAVSRMSLPSTTSYGMLDTIPRLMEKIAPDEMNLNLSLNGKKRATVKGSREQVKDFVDAINDLRRAL